MLMTNIYIDVKKNKKKLLRLISLGLDRFDRWKQGDGCGSDKRHSLGGRLHKQLV